MFKFLSIDTETTGLSEDSYIVEFAAVPVDVQKREIKKDMAFHTYIKCPSFEDLSPVLSPFARENNKSLIDTAHEKGIGLEEFKQDLSNYLESRDIQTYFGGERDKPAKPMILGKSLSALDMPLLSRDLGWDFMRKMFHHQNLDITTVALDAIVLGILPPECSSSRKLAALLLEKNDVDHTAVEDSIDVAKMYFSILDRKLKSLDKK